MDSAAFFIEVDTSSTLILVVVIFINIPSPSVPARPRWDVGELHKLGQIRSRLGHLSTRLGHLSASWASRSTRTVAGRVPGCKYGCPADGQDRRIHRQPRRHDGPAVPRRRRVGSAARSAAGGGQQQRSAVGRGGGALAAEGHARQSRACVRHTAQTLASAPTLPLTLVFAPCAGNRSRRPSVGDPATVCSSATSHAASVNSAPLTGLLPWR